MTMAPESGPGRLDGMMRHFTLHHSEADAGELLERAAAEIRSRGGIDVFDITYCAHFDGDAYVAEISVYYSAKVGGEA